MLKTLANNVVAHPQTSTAGIALAVVGLVLPMFGVKVPGFTMDPEAAISMSLVLLGLRDPLK